MGDSRFQAAYQTTFAGLFLIGLTTLRLAAVADEPKAPPAPANQKSEEIDPLKQGSPTSLTLVRAQSVIQCVELAREAVKRKDFLASLPLIERVLAEPNSFVPIDARSEVASHEEAHRLLHQMPPDLQQRLEEPRRATAIRLWDQLRMESPDSVEVFIEQYGDLPIGVDALWWLALSHRDHGRDVLSAATFLRVANHPHASPLQRAYALPAAENALSEARHSSRAAEIVQELRSIDPQLRIRVRGESVTVGEWTKARKQDHKITNDQNSFPIAADAEQERLLRPVLTPTWTTPLSLPLDSLVTTREAKQREQGVKPISILRPLVTDELVIVRSLDEILAVDLVSGERRWTIPNAEFAKIPDRFFENPNVHSLAIDWAQLRLCADSLFSRISTDGRSLFALQGPHRDGQAKMGHGDFIKGNIRQGIRQNTLCSYSLSNGDLKWEIGDSSENSDDPYHGLVFLGCPLIIDDLLYVVAQRETELELLVIESESGRLSWSLIFGAAMLPISEDLQRSRVACPVTWQDGMLICSTSAGAVVAVDPLLKTIKWAYRYPATTFASSDLVQGPNPHLSPRNHEPWWDTWREPFQAPCKIVREQKPATTQTTGSLSTILIFASPETDQLHAIDLANGQPLWRVDRDAGVLVAGIVEDRVIVLEGDFVRAHDTVTGRLLWRTTIPEAGGPGVFAGSTLILTSLSGGTMLVDTRSGHVVSDTKPADTTYYGSLIKAGSDWVLLSRQNVMRLPRLDHVQRETEQRLRDDASNESLLLQAAFLDLQAGHPEAACRRLEGLESNAALDLKRQALIDTLRSKDSSRPDAERSELIQQLKELATGPEEKFVVARAVGTSSLSVSDFVGAVDALLDGLGADLSQPDGLIKSASVMVRRDRLLLGLIDEALRKASPNNLTAIDELFANQVNIARKSRDPFAMRSLIEQWKGLDSSRKLVVQEDERNLRKRSPARTESPTRNELELLDAAGSDDADVARQALTRLAQRLDKSESTSREAFAIRRRIAFERPPENSVVPAEVLASRRLKPIWPEAIPKAEPPRSDRTFEIFTMVPMEAEPGSLAERLDVWVDRNGNEVLFRGDSFFPMGMSDGREQTFKLPTTVSPYRGPTGYMLRHAWGVGHAVILLVGTELFAISPLDSHGDPNTRFMWSNPIDLQSAPGDTRIVPVAKENQDSRLLVVDQSNRAIGKVGPVRAGYLCFQKGTKLVAVETESGQTLWERLDFPADAVVIGDDHQLFVWNEQKRVEILSAVDGRKIDERTTVRTPAEMIHQRDALVWTLTRDEAVHIELRNFRSGQLIWSRTEPAMTQVTVLDPETFGIARPDGQFHIIAARSARPLSESLQIKVESLSGIVSWYDTERWYVALTGPNHNLNSLKSLQSNDSYRLKFITGTLFAIDCQMPRVLWQRHLKDEPLSLDQSRTSPVLVQLWKLPPKGSELMLRLIDKRTGTVVFERSKEDYSPYYLLNPDPQQGVLEMKLARETIQINYSTD